MLGAKLMLKEKSLIMLPTTLATDEELLGNIHDCMTKRPDMQEYTRWMPYKVLKRKPIVRSLMRGVIEDTGQDMAWIGTVLDREVVRVRIALREQAEQFILDEIGRGVKKND